MTSKRAVSFLTTVLAFVVVAWLAYYLYANADLYLPLLRLSLWGLSALLLLTLSVPIVNGLINVYMFRTLGANLTHREGFHLAASATLANQLPIPAGLITRGLYLKRFHGLRYADYLSASLALFFCSVASNGFMGLAILSAWALLGPGRSSPTLFLGFGAMAAAALVFLIPFSRLRLPSVLGTYVAQALHGWTLISRSRALLLRLLILQVFFMILFAIRLWIAFHMLSQRLTLGQAMLLSCGSILTQVVSFAPGGLGVREAIVAGIATILGFDLTVTLAAVELDRIASTVVIVIVGWLSTILLGRRVAAMTMTSGKNHSPDAS